ncbi:uncharacterized protein EV422DRAFT_534409 [Fimicolochytrium jonesii]|uniref:uncharacterized protein n=1 Tax=Fimicolochytrium jonesii TaxID=1396493 RepID=UPI0022FF3F2C|nr:uncharacterized protein EV422DRAFT_534409 [Fimicolochytrium jonesii]KAI8819346.1 hypothetical protein EV422DRAFT_534409 [Fimicolochytrium jonesii]
MSAIIQTTQKQTTMLLPVVTRAVSQRTATRSLCRSASTFSRIVGPSAARLTPATANGLRTLPTQSRNALSRFGQARFMADKIIKCPPMAESIQEGTLTQWHKQVGEFIARDEVIATIETDKVDVTVNSPESGKVLEHFANEGDTISVGGNLFKIELGDAPAEESAPAAEKEAPKAEAPKAEAPKPKEEESKKETAKQESKPEPKKADASKIAAPAASKPPAPKPSSKAQAPVEGEEFAGQLPGSRTERRVKMNRMRLRIAERLKESQNVAASLTTFNEIDMTNLIEMRKKYKELVLEKHGVKLGFMGAFIKAASVALKEVPGVNASIEGGDIVYHDFVDVSVAVATPKGLVTPVLRNTESLSIVEVEKALSALGKKARDNQITIEDMAGGTFTVSNGGVFGSLYGTPIINQPQSAILGMHATKERAVVVNGKVEARPMMYIALTYDHRVIDGREAVTFLVKVKEIIEDPTRLLLDV